MSLLLLLLKIMYNSACLWRGGLEAGGSPVTVMSFGCRCHVHITFNTVWGIPFNSTSASQ